MIEQLRVRGHIATSAEVIHAGHDTRGEEFLPNAVHRHAGGERVAFVGKPVRELQTSTLAGWDGGELIPRSHAKGPAWNDFTWCIRIAAHVDRHVRRL